MMHGNTAPERVDRGPIVQLHDKAENTAMSVAFIPK